MKDDWHRKLVSCLAVAAVLLSAGTAFAVNFQPFSTVENVCPECESMDFDAVEMNDGQTVRCNVVAENDDFFVLERFGEVRAVSASQVKAIEWTDGEKPGNLRSQDQVVLNNGHVLTGSVVDESDKPGHFQIESSVADFSYTVFKSEIRSLYRGGSKQTIEMPEDTDDEASSE